MFVQPIRRLRHAQHRAHCVQAKKKLSVHSRPKRNIKPADREEQLALDQQRLFAVVRQTVEDLSAVRTHATACGNKSCSSS